MRARRSCLSVPASSEKMLAKARELPADEIVIDLEDAVAPVEKDDARAAAVAALGGDWGGKSVAVRVNAVDSEWFERDVLELGAAGGALESLVVPKVESPEDVIAVAALLGKAGDEEVGIQALIETAAGLVAIREISTASQRLESLIAGYADLAASLGAPAGAGYPGDRWHAVRTILLIHARAAGLAAIDGPWLAIADTGGLAESAATAAALGFDGKWAIHPSQIDPLNEIFSPAPEEVEKALAVLDALSATGVAKLDGAMIDEASRKQAERIIARAHR